MEVPDAKEVEGGKPHLLPYMPMMMNMIPGNMMHSYQLNMSYAPNMMLQRPIPSKKRRIRRLKGDSNQQNSDGPNDEELMDNMERRAYISIKGRERIQNDYNQRFVETGERPQNFVRDVGEGRRFGEYPKLDRLLNLKREIISKRATPARYIRADLRNFEFDGLRILFDVVLINPPWRTQKMRENNMNFGWTYEDLIENIPVDRIVDAMSFCFIWCDFYTLDDARNALRHWGFRKCEDICWLKTNAKWGSGSMRCSDNIKVKDIDAIYPPALLHKTTERCLVGLRGPIRRNEDDYFVHSNLDTDVIISEEPDPKIRLDMELKLQLEEGPDLQMKMDEHLIEANPKPDEIFDIIDRFCLGRRKLELFGRDATVRNGWVTVGPGISKTNYNPDEFIKWTTGNSCWPQVQDYRGGRLMGTSEEIESLRPKSPAKMAIRENTDLRNNMT
ncbi:n6-adenosine-methyltransferase non-catalytic subunit [Babesia gibsoni]|uniref:N6-adenosine-methyltransferase non-catalytic subunit n=1 Tax=Babesia gibsoni TaxID=33632 RepID=A0AAD8LPJ8_BABGI|nr:n6-adenosine-methyltransferase non-catalytic subunit [Babesia gibsoni]